MADFQRIENFKYPGGSRLAVNFTVDYDAMINRRLKNEPAMELTQGEFGGRTGVWRLLDLFERHGIKATFFTPGRICELYPRSLTAVVERGHEVANHMWEHHVPDDPKLEWDHLRRTTEALQRVSGSKPTGTRSGHSPALLQRDGYIYRSGMGDLADENPYYLRGEGEGLVVLPVHYALDDAMYYHFTWYGSPPEGQHLQHPEKVYEIWLAAFRSLYRSGGYMNIILHNFVSGRALRAAMLERLIVEMKKMPGVWFSTCEEVARYCLEAYPFRPSA
jgi:peptidoglycan/xylan/chitin deacetylase (PgdA/CDA1 family)